MRYLINLELNFVYNSDMRLGNFKSALIGFENAIKAQPNHALAFYYASECYKELGDSSKAEIYLEKARTIRDEYAYWFYFIQYFKIEI